MPLRRSIAVFFAMMAFVQAWAIETCSLTGIVTDNSSGNTLAAAAVILQGKSSKATATDADGRYSFSGLPAGDYFITVSYTGFRKFRKRIRLTGNQIENISLQGSLELQEVTVTAKEAKGPVTASRIDRSAMEFLQPTSLTDLMSLLPGGLSKDPDLSSANTISLRETGTRSAQGSQTSNQNYAISSLGTLFVVDGAPLNTDANLQYSPLSSTQSTVTGSSAEDQRNITNRGVDMRSISTDDIESVEVIRGIPSVEYGNLTSGLVKINKIRRATPFTARFKADGYSKLLSVGKGFSIGASGKTLLNIDGGILDAKPDPTNNFESYRRGNASLRLTLSRSLKAFSLRYNATADYTGSFDNSKSDPDIDVNKIEDYKSSYNRFALTNVLLLRPTKASWLKEINATIAASQQFDRLEQRRLVAPQRYGIVPTTNAEGSHDAQAVFAEYIADYLSDGKPFNAFAKVKATLQWNPATWAKNDLLVGADYDYTKNFGRGQVYDMRRPLSVSGWGSRPRAFSDIPALQQASGYVEWHGDFRAAANRFELQAGVRSNSLVGLSSRYAMQGKMYFDPRANLLWTLPAISIGDEFLQFAISGGIGKTTKMPTLNYLYPDKSYTDLSELAYYDVNDPVNRSRFVVRSYIQDPTNYNLRPATNLKKEVRLDISFAGNELSVGYFIENMTSGFRYMAIYAPYAYRDYDETAIDASALTGQPSLEGLPYTDKSVLDGYTRADNGSRLKKEGIEFQFTSARIRPLRTRINLNGAWFRSTYSNSLPMFSPVSMSIDNTALSDRYVGLYDWNDGSIYRTFTTNLMFDTQIPEWGLIFSTSLQSAWFVKSQTMRKNGVPTGYIDVADGQVHPYTEQDKTDLYLQHLVRTYADAQFNVFTVPFAMNVNLKATKQIGKIMKLAFFANKIIDYTPSFESNGYTIRRNVSPYFGVEANFTF